MQLNLYSGFLLFSIFFVYGKKFTRQPGVFLAAVMWTGIIFYFIICVYSLKVKFEEEQERENQTNENNRN